MKKEKKIDSVKIGRIINFKKDYIRNLFNGRYFLCRCNMIESQLLPGGKIIEKIDGMLKSKELLMAEYGLMRMQSIDSFRNSEFAKRELITNYDFKEEDFLEMEKRYYEGKIIEKKEIDEYRIPNKAEFVKEDEK